MAKRRSLRKSLRFEVFKRDAFTCRYCGAQPPAVVLVVDHIEAVAAGGDDDISNLVTACEPCNQGKSNKPLGAAHVRPDADLLFLETQQEIAELRRYKAAVEARSAAANGACEALADLWQDVSGLSWAPSQRILRALVDRYSPEIASYAISETAPKVDNGYLGYGKKWVGYLFTVAKNRQEREIIDADPLADVLRCDFCDSIARIAPRKFADLSECRQAWVVCEFCFEHCYPGGCCRCNELDTITRVTWIEERQDYDLVCPECFRKAVAAGETDGST